MSRKIISRDPSNDQPLGEVSVASAAEIDQAVIKAKLAAKSWQKVPMAKRLEVITRAYKGAEPKIRDLAVLLSREMGKDIRRAMGEVQGTIFGGPYIAEAAATALQGSREGNTLIQYVPLGVVAVISPWNYPLAMANNLLVPALVAGNSVVWKPSEETPLIAQEFYDLLKKELPDNVLQIVHGDGAQGKNLVASDVNMIAFTGSQAVGRKIMQESAPDLKRLVMELGGNDPMLVLADADLHAAARFAAASSFENSGQMCTSTERIYVDQRVADEFEQLVTRYATNYQVGAWDVDGVNIGPIINAKQHRSIVEHIQDALEKGATMLLGEADPAPPYIQPTVLAGMQQNMMIEQQETFGPLICISRYHDLEEALERANDSDYGLGAVVFGKEGAEDVAARLEAGMIGINQGVGGEGDSPWVGAKQSGYGFHGSSGGHRQFAQIRVVSL